MANKFDKGDIVVMKSGGPPMTVDALPGESRIAKVSSEYWCEWFKGASAEGASFAEHLLKVYEPPKA